MAKTPKMPKDKRRKCHAIIHGASAAAAGVGAGLAQIPASDTPVIVTIQVGMAVSLAGVFGLKLTKAKAEAAVLTGLAGVAGPVIARTATQILVGWIPAVGNTVNAATAFGITEMIGWIIADQLYEDSLNEVPAKPSQKRRASR